MKKWQRIVIRRMAGAMLDISDWLRDAAEHLLRCAAPRRVRPLVFPSPAWVAVEEMLDRMAQDMAQKVAKDLLYFDKPVMVRASHDGGDLKINVIKPREYLR